MADNVTPMKPRDLALLEALATGASVSVAAKQVGICERTVYRKLNEPGFRNQLDKLRADGIERTMGALAMAGVYAVETLVRLFGARSEHAAAAACRTVLEMQLRSRELIALEQRLAALEALTPRREEKWAS